MKAICLINPNDKSSFIETDVPQPQPGPGELLVRIHAAGLTPTELLWYPTSHTAVGGLRGNVIPGHEFSGVVAGLGDAVQGIRVGQEVYGMNDWFLSGAMAEFCTTRPAFVAPKPSNLTHIEAASMPIGALTAWQGLFDRARLQAGEQVLIHGGAGAVGVYAVQLARYRGARVLTTASSIHAGFLKQLGADEVIDYRRERFEDRARDIDVVFDTAGGETLERSWSVLKPGGRMVTIAAGSEAVSREGVKQAFFIVEPNRQQLIEITQLLELGRLQPVVNAVLPLADVVAAYQGRLAPQKHRGRLVVGVAAQAEARG
jgi:NADPH:quinone reductase-like Zn-dependent oxidoreductase